LKARTLCADVSTEITLRLYRDKVEKNYGHPTAPQSPAATSSLPKSMTWVLKKKRPGPEPVDGLVKAARLRFIAPRRFPSEPNMTVSALAQPFIDVNQDSEG
jgi:hypothetical protein